MALHKPRMQLLVNCEDQGVINVEDQIQAGLRLEAGELTRSQSTRVLEVLSLREESCSFLIGFICL